MKYKYGWSNSYVLFFLWKSDYCLLQLFDNGEFLDSVIVYDNIIRNMMYFWENADTLQITLHAFPLWQFIKCYYFPVNKLKPGVTETRNIFYFVIEMKAYRQIVTSIHQQEIYKSLLVGQFGGPCLV